MRLVFDMDAKDILGPCLFEEFLKNADQTPPIQTIIRVAEGYKWKVRDMCADVKDAVGQIQKLRDLLPFTPTWIEPLRSRMATETSSRKETGSGSGTGSEEKEPRPEPELKEVKLEDEEDDKEVPEADVEEQKDVEMKDPVE